MFKSKPCNSTLNQQHQYLNPSLISYSPATGPGCEGRTPEPKPRWNPRPEQIRILESIFNSGLVNPSRDEIRKIRAQLQEYGAVGDANVFYWFQNRKSRSKHKQRHLQTAASAGKHHQPPPPPPPISATLPYSPPSSSGKSSSLSPNSPAGVIDCLNSPTASVNQRAFAPGPTEFQLEEPFFYQIQQDSPVVGGLGQGFCFSGGVSGGGSVSGGGADQGFLLSELMLMSGCPSKILEDDDGGHEKMKFEEQLDYGGLAVPDTGHYFLPQSFYSPNNQIVQGVVGPTKSTVFVNDVFFEVGVGPFNVREAFGDDAMLIQSSGQPVLTDEWGITLYPLQHGAFYYLIRTTVPSSPRELITTIDLI